MAKATKKDLELKIAQLEAKLKKISAKAQTAQTTKPAEPSKPKGVLPKGAGQQAPKPAEIQTSKPKGVLPKGAGQQAPKPAEVSKPKGVLPKGTGQQAPKPAEVSKPKGVLPKGMETKPVEKSVKTTQTVNVAAALETVYDNYPMTNTHDYKAKTPGYTPSPNRYYGRLIAPRGKAPTQDWNLQKSKVTGYTAPSNQYFATRARLAYHPPKKNFEGFGLSLEGTPEKEIIAQQPKKSPSRGTLPKGF